MNSLASPPTKASRDMMISLVVLACGAINAINIAKLAPAIDVIRDVFALSLSSMGLLVSLFSLLFVTAGIFIGAGVKAIGAKRSLVIALSLALIGSCLTLIFQTQESLFIGRVIEGVGLIIVMLTGPSLVAQHTSPERRGLLMGVWSGFMPLGNALALLGAPIILIHHSWPMIWAGGIALNIVVLIVGIKVVPKDTSQSYGRIDVHAIRQAIRRPSLFILGVLFAMHSMVYQALLQFMPSFGKSIFGLPLFWSSLITVLFCLLSFSGNIVAGQLIQRGWTAFKVVLLAGLSLTGLIITISVSADLPVLFAMALVWVGVITGFTPTICFYLMSREKTEDSRNMPIFTAWMFQIQGCGMFLGPVAFALVVENQNSWLVGIGVLSVICMGKAVMAFLLRGK